MERDREVERAPATAHREGAERPRRYARPRLVVFGTVAERTRTVGTKGKKDSKRRRTGF